MPASVSSKSASNKGTLVEKTSSESNRRRLQRSLRKMLSSVKPMSTPLPTAALPPYRRVIE